MWYIIALLSHYSIIYSTGNNHYCMCILAFQCKSFLLNIIRCFECLIVVLQKFAMMLQSLLAHNNELCQ